MRKNNALWILLGIVFVILIVLWLTVKAIGAVLGFIFSFKGLLILLVVVLLYRVMRRRR